MKKQKVLIVDDEPKNRRIILEILGDVVDCRVAETGIEAIKTFDEFDPDLLFLDIMMPGMDGYEVCRRIKENSRAVFVKIILVSGKVMTDERLKGYECGADDYITKPFVHEELQAKANVFLRLTRLERQSQAHVQNLSRFFPPHLVESILSGKTEDPFTWRKADVTTLFIDLRGFTRFTESQEPSQVMSLLQEYYRTVAQVAHAHQGTIGHLAGDGIMVVFNDLLKIPDHEMAAATMAVATREALQRFLAKWQKAGSELGFGMGIANGTAIIGGIGTEGFWDFSVVGVGTNLASRLCGIAAGGQILVSERFSARLGDYFQVSRMADMAFKGIQGNVKVYNIETKIQGNNP